MLILLLTTSLASALGEGSTIHVTRLTGTIVGIKIKFDSDISGDFAGVIHGKHFDCVTVGPRTLYCVGPLAYWVGSATLHIYETPSGNVILTRVISAPPKVGESGVTLPEPPQDEPQ